MPVYEFYCEQCNTIYNFLSRSVNTRKTPDCPKCGKKELKRKPSLFAAVSGKKEEAAAETPPFDMAKMEKAMSLLASEGAGISEDDSRHAAKLMKRLSEAAGLSMGPAMEEAIRRLEQGEDPDVIEEEMGDLLEEEDPFAQEKKTKRRGVRPRPCIDDTLYEL